jgi:hypothetical protein
MQSEPRASWLGFSWHIVLAFCLFSLPAGARIMSPLQSGISPQQKPAGTPGEISGHIYSADTGEPLSEATVVLFSQLPIAGRLPEAHTGSDGSFDFPAIAPGDYSVEVSAFGFLGKAYVGQDGPQVRAKFISVTPGQRIQGTDVYLDRAGTISGTVHDENGTPVRSVMVFAATGGVPAGEYIVTVGAIEQAHTKWLGYLRSRICKSVDGSEANTNTPMRSAM